MGYPLEKINKIKRSLGKRIWYDSYNSVLVGTTQNPGLWLPKFTAKTDHETPFYNYIQTVQNVQLQHVNSQKCFSNYSFQKEP